MLIITLKRFAQTSYATRQKIDTCVQFPINGLNLSPFCTLVSANESVWIYFFIVVHMQTRVNEVE